MALPTATEPNLVRHEQEVHLNRATILRKVCASVCVTRWDIDLLRQVALCRCPSPLPRPLHAFVVIYRSAPKVTSMIMCSHVVNVAI